MTGTTSEFGVQFDSLADVVSFGVAPALMAYAWGVRSLPGQDTLAVEQISQVGWICCLLFPDLLRLAAPRASKCRAWRPASSRISSAFHARRRGVIAAFVHGLNSRCTTSVWAMVWLFVVAALGALK